MTKEELMDILGEVSDKFYAEAMEEEPLQAKLITVSKTASRGRIFRIAAGTAAGIAAAVGITAAAIKYNTNDLHSITIENIEYCKNYIAEISEEDASGFGYRILDLNFDEKEELLLMSEEYSSPLYIFNNAENGMELATVLGAGADRAYLPSLDGLYPFEGEKERYYYYSFSFDNGGVMEARVAAALKYSEEDNYYTENLLSYGMLSYEGTALPASVFYRKGWNPQDILPTGYPEDMEEEPFRELWGQYSELPAITFEDFRQNNSASLLTPQAREICDSYIAENYSENVSDIGNLSYYTKDLNFDGTDEIIAVVWEDNASSDSTAVSDPFSIKCPLFIFEQKDGIPAFNCILGEDGHRGFIDEDAFASLVPYDDNGEKYYYYYFETPYSETKDIIGSRVAAAIKYDGEKFYTQYLLSYGVYRYGDSSFNEVLFYGTGWNTSIMTYDNIVENGVLHTEKLRNVEFEEFQDLWGEYKELPPVFFGDLSRYAVNDDDHLALTYDYAGYEYSYEYALYYIDEDKNVTTLEGETTWEAYDDLSAAMLQFNSLEYLGVVENISAGNLRVESGKIYRYKDNILLLFNPPQEWFADTTLEIEFGPSFYEAAMLRPCRGHMLDYTELNDINSLPDIEGSGSSSYEFTEIEYGNYCALYHYFRRSVLYSEKVGEYEFWLVGEKLRTDKKTDPNKIYCSELYVLIWKNYEIFTRIDVSSRSFNELPIDGDFSDYSVQVYQLKDGMVIFDPNEDTSDYLSPFLTLFENEDINGVKALHGDFTPLTEWGSFETDGFSGDYITLKRDISFTANPEENTLYYGSTAFKFDFSKVDEGLDENGNITECFTVYEID